MQPSGAQTRGRRQDNQAAEQLKRREHARRMLEFKREAEEIGLTLDEYLEATCKTN